MPTALMHRVKDVSPSPPPPPNLKIVPGSIRTKDNFSGVAGAGPTSFSCLHL